MKITLFGYEWGYAFGNVYDNGAFWFTRDGDGLWCPFQLCMHLHSERMGIVDSEWEQNISL